MKMSPTLENGTGKVPIDLFIEIFLRLPLKSIAMCRCVSKLWSSILDRPDFTEFFLTRSCACPKLLFAYKKAGHWFFFSSPQTQNPDDNSSSLVANYHMKFSVDSFYQIPRPVNGLLCLKHDRLLNGINETVVVICNPTTRQSLSLPKLNTGRLRSKTFFGYDPIGKQFKVLVSSTHHERHQLFDEYQILTLRPGKSMLWRRIQCCIVPHYSPVRTDTGICINGVLYYPVNTSPVKNSPSPYMIASFDVRSEEFGFIRAMCDGILINYNGKLGLFSSQKYPRDRFDTSKGSIEFWVLKDVGKQEWSKHTYVLPAMWKNIVGTTDLRFVGMNLTHEFVFHSLELRPFYVFYYNVHKNTIKRVQIQGIEAFQDTIGFTIFANHVENLKLMQNF